MTDNNQEVIDILVRALGLVSDDAKRKAQLYEIQVQYAVEANERIDNITKINTDLIKTNVDLAREIHDLKLENSKLHKLTDNGGGV